MNHQGWEEFLLPDELLAEVDRRLSSADFLVSLDVLEGILRVATPLVIEQYVTTTFVAWDFIFNGHVEVVDFDLPDDEDEEPAAEVVEDVVSDPADFPNELERWLKERTEGGR